MTISDIGLAITTIGSAIAGCWAVYAKGVKPFLTWVKKFEKAEVSQIKFLAVERKIEYVSSTLHTVINHSDVPYFICSELGLCIMANESVCSLFGAVPDEMKGFGWMEFIITKEEHDHVRDRWDGAVESGSNIKFNCKIKNGNNGLVYDLKFHASFARNEEHKIIVSVVKVTHNPQT